MWNEYKNHSDTHFGIKCFISYKKRHSFTFYSKIKGCSKSFYLGKEDKIKKDIMNKLNKDWSDYSTNKLKFGLRDIIETVIMDFID